ncbi:MAG: hypothetical protein JXA53_01385 [Bacteroidales bacterium]|nr:hypothetical protein [Bacteroidales bacterium]
MRIKILLSILLLFLFKKSISQYYVSGVENPKIKWEQIETNKFILVYPIDFRENALNISTYIDNAYDIINADMNPMQGKFEIIFRTHTVQSNGMVAWTPKRAEFYITPSADGYSQQWIQQLILHELRHIGQLSQLNHGIIKAAYPIIGQQNIGAASAHFPSWVLEGDAVVSETQLSETGRGRSPEFFRDLRTRLLAGKMWKYDNANLGSFNKQTISEYQLGYPIMAYIYSNSTKSPIANACEYISKYPFNPVAIDAAFRKSSNTSINKAFNNTTSSLKQFWQQSADTSEWYSGKILHKSSSKYQNYRYPCVTNNGNIIALKSSPCKAQTFVIIDKKGKEKDLFTPTHGQIDNITYSNNTIVWSGWIPGISYDYDDYKDLFSYNLITKKHKRLTYRKNYQAASISRNGKYIVAVSYSPTGSSQLLVLHPITGQIITKTNIPSDINIQKPVISDDGNYVACTFVDNNGKGIKIYNFDKQQWSTILNSQNKYINRVIWNGDNLIFEGDYKGVENLYSMNTKTKQLSLISKVMFGAIDPCVTSDSTLVYADYSVNGFRVAQLNITKQPVSNFMTDNKYYPFTQMLGSKKTFSFESTDTTQYIPKPYRKLPHAINVHSWIPVYADIDDLKAGRTAIYPGATLLSQNLMSNTILTGTAYYKDNDFWSNLELTYNGWAIKIGASYNYGDHRLLYNKNELYYYGKKHEAKLSFTLPVNLTDGNRYRLFKPYLYLSYDNTKFVERYSNTLKTGLLDYNLGFIYSDSKATAKADITPRRGKFLNVGLIGSANTSTFGKTFYAKAGVYTPGLMQNHSILLQTGYLSQKSDYYYHTSVLPVVRGELASKFALQEMVTASFDYTLPICHPDLNILGLIYIKRIRADLFYDWAYTYNWKETRILNSTGVELNMDFLAFRTKVPINLGIRTGYLLNSNQPFTELLYGFKFDAL